MLQHKKSQHDETTIVELVDGFKKLKGIKLYLEVLKWVFTGMFMGASDAIPGYSGGTTLALTGFFRRLILVAKSIFVPEPGLTRRKAFMFMLPFGIGWIIGVFGFAKLTEALAHNGRLSLELMVFFAAFVLFAIPVYLKGNDPKLSRTSTKKGKKFRWTLFIIGFVVIVTIAFVVQFVKGGAPFHGHEKGSEEFVVSQDWWRVLLIAYVAGCATIMPGGSGALIQLLANVYALIHWHIMAGLTENSSNALGLLFFAAGSFGGMITVIFIFSWLLKHHETNLAALSLGMLVASVLAILIVINFNDSWKHFSHWYHILGAVAAAFLGAGFAFIIKWHVDKRIKSQNAKYGHDGDLSTIETTKVEIEKAPIKNTKK